MTQMQHAFIMASIMQSYPVVYASINQLYKLREAIRRVEIDDRSHIQHCIYLTTEQNYLGWIEMDGDG